MIYYVAGATTQQMVREGYRRARLASESVAICFVPSQLQRGLLNVRIFNCSQLRAGPCSKGLEGYGNMMIYRICAPVEVGYKAKHAGLAPPEEITVLNELIALGWNKTYKWVELERLDPRRPVEIGDSQPLEGNEDAETQKEKSVPKTERRV